MAKIGLIDVDGHNYPNIPLMKISEWHKRKGDITEMCIPICRYDMCYQSKVFTDEYTKDIDWEPIADQVIKGGTGYGLRNKLPAEIEHIYPDYSLYGIEDTAYGFLSRGCPRECGFCIVSEKEGRRSIKVADLDEFWNGQKNIVLMDPNILACSEHMDLMEQLVKSGAKVDINQGLDIRLMDDDEIDMINRMRLKNIHFAWDNPSESLEERFAYYSERASKKPNGAYGSVFVLTNYGTSFADDMYRVTLLRDLGYDPYVMIYDKPHASLQTKRLASWANNRILFKSCPDFNDVRWRNNSLSVYR